MPKIAYVERRFSNDTLGVIDTAEQICEGVLDELINDAVGSYRDDVRWDESTRAMRAQRRLLDQVSERWSEVAELVGEEG